MKLVILDRDGVINEDSDAYIKSPAEWLPLPGSLEAIARLHRGGWHVAVATNQSGVERGLFTLDTLHAMHAKMQQLVQAAGGELADIVYCTATTADHPDRKPNPGMLLTLAARCGVPIQGVPVVGDALRDIQAALAVDAQPYLVLTGKGRKTVQQLATLTCRVPVLPDLAAVADFLLAQRN